MRVRPWIVTTLAFVLVLLAVATTTPRAQTPTAEQIPAEIPDEARKRPNPRPASLESVAAGRQTFSSQCTMCHGATGDGKGDLVPRLKLTMPDFTDRSQQAKRTDGELFYILTHGHGRMRGEGDRLSDQIKWDLVNYVRSLGSES